METVLAPGAGKRKRVVGKEINEHRECREGGDREMNGVEEGWERGFKKRTLFPL